MRIVLFFDLPTITYHDRKAYSDFRKFLIKNGFIMLQESVYSKLVLNQVMTQQLRQKLKKACPKKGYVQTLVVTERQYSKMEYLVGRSQNKIEDSDKRFIIV